MREHLLDRIAITLSADVTTSWQERVNAVEAATRFQDAPTEVLSEVEDTTDALRTQVGGGLVGCGGWAREWGLTCMNLGSRRPVRLDSQLLAQPRHHRLACCAAACLPACRRLCLRGNTSRRCSSERSRPSTWWRRRGEGGCRCAALTLLLGWRGVSDW